MFKIITNQRIAADTYRILIDAPLVSGKFKAGQFVVLRPLETSERIPLTIMRADPEKGTIALIVKAIGLTTRQLCSLQSGQSVADLLGPLGHPSEIGLFGTVVILGGGVGSAVAFAVAETLKAAGNRILAIIGGRDKDNIILEEEFRQISDEVIITTDDGSYGTKGFVTSQLEKLYADGTRIDRVIAAGPLPMMKLAAEITRLHHTATIVSLNPIMVDGIGMCGGCRALVDGKVAFVCVEGPEFDAHKVDFDSLMRRNDAYHDIEQQKDHACKLDALISKSRE